MFDIQKEDVYKRQFIERICDAYQVSRLFWRRMAGNWLWWVTWAGMIIPWHHRNIQEMFWMV